MRWPFKRPTASDVLHNLRDGASISATCEDGWIKVMVDDQTLFEGTITDSTVTFIALAGIMGKKNAKRLISLEQ